MDFRVCFAIIHVSGARVFKTIFLSTIGAFIVDIGGCAIFTRNHSSFLPFFDNVYSD
jgi:hypothetical protein